MNRLIAKFVILSFAFLLLVGGNRVLTTAQDASPAAPPQEITFPELTGPYKVGLVSFEWVDQSRDETFASIPGLKRDLMVYIWFPASPAKRAKIAPYMLGDLTWNIWSGHTGQDSLVHSHAYSTNALNADKASYPVLIFSGGLGLSALNYASNIEEIASHGYIVIGTSHPYSDGVVSYPDGRVVIGATGDKVVVDGALRRDFAAPLLTLWTQDIRFVLDQAEKLNATDDKFKGRLDLTRVGVLGHALGGLTAAEVTALDPRVKAGANLDSASLLVITGTGDVTIDVTTKPMLFMENYNLTATPMLNGQEKYLVVANQISSLNYGDFAFLDSFIPEWHAGGSIDPARAGQIIDGYLLAFFDHYLKDSDLDWPTYDEAKLTTNQ